MIIAQEEERFQITFASSKQKIRMPEVDFFSFEKMDKFRKICALKKLIRKNTKEICVVILYLIMIKIDTQIFYQRGNTYTLVPNK